MKYSTIIFYLYIHVSCGFLYAQQEHSFIEDATKEWTVLSCPSKNYSYYFFQGDTIIEGERYHKMYQSYEEFVNNTLSNPIYMGAIMEENKKVYIRCNPEVFGDDRKLLVYDFSLQENDTIALPFIGIFSGGDVAKINLKVSKLEYVEVEGHQRKKWTLEWIDRNRRDEVWVEGIGSLQGPLHSGSQDISHFSFELLFVKTKEDHIYCNSFPDAFVCASTKYNCEDVVYSEIGNIIDRTKLLAYNDPSHQLTTFKFELNTPAKVHLDVYNMQGQKVSILIDDEHLSIGLHEKVFESPSISLGMYYAVLSIDGVLIDSQKFIIY